MLNSDALIFTTPVFVLNINGAIKALLEHFGFMFMVHRPRLQMFGKIAYILATTAGARTKTAIKTIAENK